MVSLRPVVFAAVEVGETATAGVIVVGTEVTVSVVGIGASVVEIVDGAATEVVNEEAVSIFRLDALLCD